MTDSRPPVLVINPRDDEAMRRAAHAALEAGASTPALLAAALRDAYPLVVVRPRALSSEQEVVWYVYREGHWTR